MTAGTVVITGGILATVILLCIIAVLCYCRLQVRLWLCVCVRVCIVLSQSFLSCYQFDFVECFFDLIMKVFHFHHESPGC